MYEIRYYENSGQIIEAGGEAYLINILDLERYNDAYQIIDIIDNYAKEHNGTCEIEIVNSENNT